MLAGEKDPEATPEPVEPASLSMGYDGGRFRLRYDAPAEVGALVEAALAEAKDQLFHALWLSTHPRLPRHVVDGLTCDGTLTPVWEAATPSSSTATTGAASPAAAPPTTSRSTTSCTGATGARPTGHGSAGAATRPPARHSTCTWSTSPRPDLPAAHGRAGQTSTVYVTTSRTWLMS